MIHISNKITIQALFETCKNFFENSSELDNAFHLDKLLEGKTGSEKAHIRRLLYKMEDLRLINIVSKRVARKNKFNEWSPSNVVEIKEDKFHLINPEYIIINAKEKHPIKQNPLLDTTKPLRSIPIAYRVVLLKKNNGDLDAFCSGKQVFYKDETTEFIDVTAFPLKIQAKRDYKRRN